MILILIIIIISLGKMLLSYNYFKHITHAVVIITHGKRIGYVILPKPNLSSRECTVYTLVVAVLTCGFSPCGSISRRYDRSSRRSDCLSSDGSLVFNRDRICRRSWTRGDSGLAIVFGCFSPIIFFAGPPWDANSWEEGMSVDTNRLRYFPRRSSSN